jgi:hypothetical protein
VYNAVFGHQKEVTFKMTIFWTEYRVFILNVTSVLFQNDYFLILASPPLSSPKDSTVEQLPDFLGRPVQFMNGNDPSKPLLKDSLVEGGGSEEALGDGARQQLPFFLLFPSLPPSFPVPSTPIPFLQPYFSPPLLSPSSLWCWYWWYWY